MFHNTHRAVDADKWLVGVDDWLAEIAALEAVEAKLIMLPPVPPAHVDLADVPPVQRSPLGPPVRCRLPLVSRLPLGPPVWRHLPLVAPLAIESLLPCASLVRASCAFTSRTRVPRVRGYPVVGPIARVYIRS